MLILGDDNGEWTTFLACKETMKEETHLHKAKENGLSLLPSSSDDDDATNICAEALHNQCEVAVTAQTLAETSRQRRSHGSFSRQSHTIIMGIFSILLLAALPVTFEWNNCADQWQAFYVVSAFCLLAMASLRWQQFISLSAAVVLWVWTAVGASFGLLPLVLARDTRRHSSSSSSSWRLHHLLFLWTLLQIQTQQATSYIYTEAFAQSSIEATAYCSASRIPLPNSDEESLVYRMGVLSNRGDDVAFREFNKTFGDYLTLTAGALFDPPIRFEMQTATFNNVFGDCEERLLDYIFVNPSIFSCIESEFGAQSLVSKISRRVVGGHGYDLTRFGGVIATLANNTQINSIQDLKGKIIGAASISGLGSGQMQFRKMQDAGMSYINDPKQLVFTENQQDIVQGLLDGDFDVAFVRTDQLERTKDSQGNPVNVPAIFKVIDPQPNLVNDDGTPFPFQSSTPLYPEWNLAALPHVPNDVSSAVQEAMKALAQHARAGKNLEECEQGFNTTYCESLPFPQLFDSRARCDTTREIARVAHEAMRDGNYAGWRTTLSYMQLRSMQETTGFIRLDKQDEVWRCVRSTEIYEAIVCPKGSFRITKGEVERRCGDIGLPCKPGYQCLCSPCYNGIDVEVFPFEPLHHHLHPGHGDHEHLHHGHRRLLGQDDDGGEEGITLVGCPKMSICGKTVRLEPITLWVVDRLERENAQMTVHVHERENNFHVNCTFLGRLDDNHGFVSQFTLPAEELGALTIEIFLDGEQIVESPLRVLVTNPDCEALFGSHYEPNGDGECVCKSEYVEVGGSCLSYLILLPSILLPFCVVIGVVSLLYVQQKRREADSIWTVNPRELRLPDKPVVLGRGTFGVVLLGKLHGTDVAVKKVLPPLHHTEGTHTRDSGDMESGGGLNSGGQSLGAGELLTNKLGLSSEAFGTVSGYRVGLRTHGYLSDLNLEGPTESSSAGMKSRSFFCLGSKDKYERLKAEFIQEMRLLSKLRHPCITTVMGAVVYGADEPLLIMEHMSFGSLYDILHNDTMYIDGELLLPIMRDIAQGIRFLHSTDPQVIHGDIKSKNVLVSQGFRAKVADFGLSQKRRNAIKAIGTPYWMAPELLRGESRNTTASDIYSMGIVLYELYSRKTPYEGLNTAAVLKLVCDPLVNKRPLVPSGTPPEICSLMKSCWKGISVQRPTAEEIDERLKMMPVENAEPFSTRKEHSSNENRVDGSEISTTQQQRMYQHFPNHVAAALLRGEKVDPENHECVTLVVSNIVDFQRIVTGFPPSKASAMLDRVCLALDGVVKKHDLFKLETIKEGYMAVGNLHQNQQDHAKRAAVFALEAIQAVSKEPIDSEDPSKGFVQLSVGLHSGTLVSNVVGTLNPRFSVFGDSINVASKMERFSAPQKILCSASSAELLLGQAADSITLTRRESGKADTYWVSSRECLEVSSVASLGIQTFRGPLCLNR